MVPFIHTNQYHEHNRGANVYICFLSPFFKQLYKQFLTDLTFNELIVSWIECISENVNLCFRLIMASFYTCMIEYVL